MPKPAEFIAAAHWALGLEPGLRERAIAETVVRPAPAGTLVCRKGEAVEHWIGVVDGLVKMANVSLDGRPTSFTGIPSGGWFGEGSLLKDEPRRYDIVALRESTIAYMPRATFMALLDGSVAFNRFLLVQLNERLGQFIATVEYERLLGPDARVARCIAQLFNPLLYPGSGRQLRISQSEVGYLTGLSRQRANQALQTLEASGLIRVEYGGITVADLDGLSRYEG
jgi:CRP/FNR family cyclic AMP-dependent transcriptional regulator